MRGKMKCDAMLSFFQSMHCNVRVYNEPNSEFSDRENTTELIKAQTLTKQK